MKLQKEIWKNYQVVRVDDYKIPTWTQSDMLTSEKSEGQCFNVYVYVFLCLVLCVLIRLSLSLCFFDISSHAPPPELESSYCTHTLKKMAGHLQTFATNSDVYIRLVHNVTQGLASNCLAMCFHIQYRHVAAKYD